MKKIVPNGAVIKEIRTQRTHGSLQKEMAHAVGISVRLLRLIENANHPVTLTILEHVAAYLCVPKERIAFAIDAPKLVPPVAKAVVSTWAKDRLIPRYDEEHARVCMDERALYEAASGSHDMRTHLKTNLTDETSAYVDELVLILSALTWTNRDILREIPMTEELSMRCRIRQLLVLLKGNDVWLYEARHFRSLPERDTVPPPGDRPQIESRLEVAFGPPGEYGEDWISVPVDHGQPYILKAWDKFKKELEA